MMCPSASKPYAMRSPGATRSCSRGTSPLSPTRGLCRWVPLEAVASVCTAAGRLSLEVVEGLSTLLDQFLLQREEVAGSGEVRLGMLEMLREYAQEQLEACGEVEATQRGHAHYYLALAEAASPELTSAQQARWFARLEREYENLRAALRWARAADEGEVGLRLAGALWRFWYTRGHLSEGRAWLAVFLALTRRGYTGAPGAPAGAGTPGSRHLASQQGESRTGGGVFKLLLWPSIAPWETRRRSQPP